MASLSMVCTGGQATFDVNAPHGGLGYDMVVLPSYSSPSPSASHIHLRPW
jgi:hypothetical protein